MGFDATTHIGGVDEAICGGNQDRTIDGRQIGAHLAGNTESVSALECWDRTLTDDGDGSGTGSMRGDNQAVEESESGDSHRGLWSNQN